MHHILKARVAIVRHVTIVTRHPHINISCNKRKVAVTKHKLTTTRHSLKFISSPRIELARHEATQGKYSPKSLKNAVKSWNSRNMRMPSINIKIYKYNS